MGNKIVLHTLGSFGDLHPYMAIGRELKERGHHPVMATHEFYREKVQAQGLDFHPVRPDLNPDDQELSRQIMDLKNGPETVLRQVIFPAIRDTFQDLMGTMDGADLLVSAAITFAAPLVAEKTGVRWVSGTLSPMQFWSIHDMPVLGSHRHLSFLRRLGPRVNRWLVNYGKSLTLKWAGPMMELRRELGLPTAIPHPIFEGQFSPLRVLAMFSPLMGATQPDWPSQTVTTGFVFFDEETETEDAQLEEFLGNGTPPIVFTLGTAAVNDAGSFYHESLAAARALERRALLLTGNHPRNLPEDLDADCLALPYAPFSKVFPRAAAIVHQGGIGTCAQALRSGRPMLVVPHSHDQPDNAARLRKLGVAKTINRHQYRARRIARELNEVMGHAEYAVRAARAGKRVQLEDGIYRACSELEKILPRR